jgi:hypothetical protein
MDGSFGGSILTKSPFRFGTGSKRRTASWSEILPTGTGLLSTFSEDSLLCSSLALLLELLTRLWKIGNLCDAFSYDM